MRPTCVFVQAWERHADVPNHRGRVGLNHLAFWAESRDQIIVLTEQVRARGLRVLYEDQHPFAEAGITTLSILKIPIVSRWS